MLWAALLAVSALAAAAAEPVPAFQIVSEDGEVSARRIAVRMAQPLAEAALKAMADVISARQPKGTTVDVIRIYLPDMKLSETPWADVRPGQSMKITINGLRAGEIETYRAEAAADTRNVIGVWLTAAPAVPGRLTIWRDKNGKHFAEWRLRNGQKTTDELDENKVSRGRRFDIRVSNGGYYLVAWNGALELGEKSTVIAVAERLTFDKAAPTIAPAQTSTRSVHGDANANAEAAAVTQPKSPVTAVPAPASSTKAIAEKPERAKPRNSRKPERPAPEASAGSTLSSAMTR